MISRGGTSGSARALRAGGLSLRRLLRDALAGSWVVMAADDAGVTAGRDGAGVGHGGLITSALRLLRGRAQWAWNLKSTERELFGKLVVILTEY